MLTGKKIILFGAGIYGRRALSFFSADKVHCFVDNYKAGQEFWGKPIISFEELKKIKDDYDVVLSVTIALVPVLGEQCQKNSIDYSLLSDLMSYERFESDPDIKRFENRHMGERCFLIGNGPSLKAEDLTRLRDCSEVTFACNAIKNIYFRTPWRPKYYTITDPMFFGPSRELLTDLEAECLFIPALSDNYAACTAELMELLAQSGREIYQFRPITNMHLLEGPRFSPDASRALFVSGTVMYTMIQLAVYMGFTDIYLLGVDGTASLPTNPDVYFAEKRHFYEEDDNVVTRFNNYIANTMSAEDVSILVANAYRQAERYSKEHGIRIYNATRGGVVDAFTRVNFDSLF